MIHVFHDENVDETTNSTSTVLFEEMENKVQGKQKDIRSDAHPYHPNCFNPAPAPSSTSNSTLSTSQSSSHSFRSSIHFDHIQQKDLSNKTKRRPSESTSTNSQSSEMSRTTSSFHRQTRSIVDIIVAVENSKLISNNSWANRMNQMQQSQGISSIVGSIETQLAIPASAPAPIGFIDENSKQSILQDQIPLPPPPKPNATKQEHHRYFYALRKATRSRKQLEKQQNMVNNDGGYQNQTNEIQLNPNQNSSFIVHNNEIIEQKQSSYDPSPRDTYHHSSYSDPPSYLAMLAWRKASMLNYTKQFNQNYPIAQRPSLSSAVHKKKNLYQVEDQEFLTEILHSDDQETKLLFGELNETMRLQHAELGV